MFKLPRFTNVRIVRSFVCLLRQCITLKILQSAAFCIVTNKNNDVQLFA